MADFVVKPDDLRAAAGRFAAAAGEVDAQAAALRARLAELDGTAWREVALGGDLLANLQSVKGRGESLARSLHLLATVLRRAAGAFEETDAAGAAAVGEVAAPWAAGEGGWDLRGIVPGLENPGLESVEWVPRARELGMTVAYGPVDGQLFIRGRADEGEIDPTDVKQGMIGTCYLLSSLAAMATLSGFETGRDLLRRNVRATADGTYTVTFYKETEKGSGEWEPVEIEVSPDFPLLDGKPAFARPADRHGHEQELWVMVYEKAYARYDELYGEGEGYAGVHGGRADEALTILTGVPSEVFDLDARNAIGPGELAAYREAGYAITAASLNDRRGERMLYEKWNLKISSDLPDDYESNPWYRDGERPHKLYPKHEYYVVGVDEGTGEVLLRNPHDWYGGLIVVPYDEFKEAFDRVTVNRVVRP